MPRDLKTLHSVQYIPQKPENRAMQLRTSKISAPRSICYRVLLQIRVQNQLEINMNGSWINDEELMMKKVVKKLPVEAGELRYRG